MAALSYRSSPAQRSPRQRATSLLLTVLVHLLLLWLLLTLAPQIVRRPPNTSMSSFDVAAEGDRQDAPAPAARAERRAAERAETVRQPPPPPPPPPSVAVEQPGAITLPSEIMSLSRSDYTASNVAGMPRTARGAETGDKAESGAGDAGEAVASGGGGAGERMYDVDWYRRPTSAELAFYLPKRAGPITGWGLIACRTASGYRVEDCRELDQYPAGSGLSRAVRQAAWQFRVLPPRRGSTPILGAWVRIRIEYTPRGAEAR